MNFPSSQLCRLPDFVDLVFHGFGSKLDLFVSSSYKNKAQQQRQPEKNTFPKMVPD